MGIKGHGHLASQDLAMDTIALGHLASLGPDHGHQRAWPLGQSGTWPWIPKRSATWPVRDLTMDTKGLGHLASRALADILSRLSIVGAGLAVGVRRRPST